MSTPLPPDPPHGAVPVDNADSSPARPPVPPLQPKSPVAAAILATIPLGLGHLYLGLYQRALFLFAAFWFSILIEVIPLALFCWFFTVIDAYRQADLVNLGGVEPRPGPANSLQGKLSLGIFLVVFGLLLLVKINRWIDLDFLIDWLQDFWPLAIIILGVYFIVGAIREQREKKHDEDDVEDDTQL